MSSHFTFHLSVWFFAFIGLQWVCQLPCYHITTIAIRYREIKGSDSHILKYLMWYWHMRKNIWHLPKGPHRMWQYTTISFGYNYPDSKVHGTNMGPIWGRQDPGGPMLAREPCYLGTWALQLDFMMSVMKLTQFPRYWSFVRGISHRWIPFTKGQ